MSLLALLFCVAPVSAADADAADSSQAAADMAARIDALLAERWTKEGVKPSLPADDAELVRRLYLDLTGVIPTAAEARAFLEEESPQKRPELIDRLLASGMHSTHLADVWRDLLLPRRVDPEQVAGLVGLQNWLRRQFAENERYDQMVADLLVATGGDESGPALFYTALQLKPEELGTTTARMFLGVRLDCAQCHDHPFDRWSQQDFWGYAAFFARLRQRSRNAPGMSLVEVESGEVKLPDTETVVPPRYPGGVLVDPNELGTRRQQLAIWTVSRDNIYLGPATVNLVWAQLFGRGLVEPLDDFGKHNPPSHPQLLTELSEYFVNSGYDLRQLFRTIANTRAYQLSSRRSGDVDPPPALFARMAVKSLSPEQFYDSMARVALRGGGRVDRLSDPERLGFLAKMQTANRSVTHFELGVPQVLALMNGTELSKVSDAPQGGLLAALEAPFLDDAQRVESAFLGTLTRLPSDAERTHFVRYVQNASVDEKRQSLGDVVWALVNSAEFALNH